MRRRAVRAALTLVLFLAVPNLEAAPTLLDQGRTAETAENYQAAVDLYRQAMAASPNNPAPARALAELFTAKGLHELALPVWQETVRRAPGDPEAWLSLAQGWSYLDDNLRSVKTLDDAFARFPTDANVVEALAWMLFKTEDFGRGIALVETYLGARGPDRALEMTLGTLYSSLFDYDRSRIHYLKAIDLAQGKSSEVRDFRAIALYNLSLLEKGFYQFDLADQAIRKSIDEEDRPAGTIALGELFQGRRDFAEARRLFEKAALTDDTPLARFDLARLLQQFGFLDEAEAQLVQVEHHQDDTWLYNYGVTKDKVLRDIHELRADLHRSRFHALDFTPRITPWDWLVWGWSKVKEGLLWWYHYQTWKSLLVKLSNSSMAVSNSPDAWVGLTLANRDHPPLALKYLALVKNHELPRNPLSRASYEVEEGIIRKDAPLLGHALTLAQIPWENEDRERALATLVAVLRAQGKTAEANQRLSQLYALNPGSLPDHGWGLPVRVGVFGEATQTAGWKDAVTAFAAQSGWAAAFADQPGVTSTLDLQATPAGAAWTLRDADGKTLKSGLVRSSGDRLGTIAEIFRQIHRVK